MATPFLTGAAPSELLHRSVPKTKASIDDIARRLRGLPPSDSAAYTPAASHCAMWDKQSFELHRAVMRRLSPGELGELLSTRYLPLVLVIAPEQGEVDAIGSLDALRAIQQFYKNRLTLPHCPCNGWTIKILHV